MTLRKVPIKNISAHPVRNAILILLTLAQAICVFGGIEMMRGMQQELDVASERLGADLLVYPMEAVSKMNMDDLLMQGTPVEVYKDKQALSRMDACEGIEKVTYQTYISCPISSTGETGEQKDTNAGENGSRITIVGYEPETDFVLKPWISGEDPVSGGAQTPGTESTQNAGNESAQTAPNRDLQIPTGCVMVGSKVDVANDSTVTLFSKKWKVAARMSETGSVLDEEIFAPTDTFEEIVGAAQEAGGKEYGAVRPGAVFSVALVRVSDKSMVNKVTDWINIYVRKVKAVRSEQALSQAASGIDKTAETMMVIAGLAWLVLMISLGITQSMLMKERVREMFVWHTIGASGGVVNFVMLTEALIVHAVGAVLGVIFALPLLAVFGEKILPGFELGLQSSIIAGAAAVVVTTAFGLVFTFFAVKFATKKLNGQMLLTI